MKGRHTTPWSRTTVTVLAIAAAGLAITGCGSSGGGSSSASTAGSSTSATPAGSRVLDIQASPSAFAFVPNTLTASPGRITIRMTNPSQLQHAVALQVPGVAAGQVVGNGGVSEVTATLSAGTYTFYCPVPGHRAAGMTGTLTVR
jgi:plastocyanin